MAEPQGGFLLASLQDITSLLHTIYEVVDSSVNHSPTSSKTLRVKLTVAPDGSQAKKGILLNHPGEGLGGRPDHRGQSTPSSQKGSHPTDLGGVEGSPWGAFPGSDFVDRWNLNSSLNEQDLDKKGITGGRPYVGRARAWTWHMRSLWGRR